MKGWHKLYITRNSSEANIIKGMLEQNNIPVLMMNNLDSNYLSFGYIELYVQDIFKDVAKALLDKGLMN